jgi:hypothetical protein
MRSVRVIVAPRARTLPACAGVRDCSSRCSIALGACRQARGEATGRLTRSRDTSKPSTHAALELRNPTTAKVSEAKSVRGKGKR